jgi:hypothetical protein
MKMEITVQIKKADGTHAAETTTMEVDVPDFEAFTGPDNFGRIFNEYEQNVLKARNEVIAAATQKYLHELAKKKAAKSARQENVVKRPRTYRIDAEIGRLQIDVCELKSGSQKVFSPQGDVFPEIASREYYQTPCFKELAVLFPCDESFRQSAHKINRVLRRGEEDAIQHRTIANMVEREGQLIQEYMQDKAEKILKLHGFTSAGKPMASKKEGGLARQHGSLEESRPYESRDNQEDAEEAPHNGSSQTQAKEPASVPLTITEEIISQAIEEINTDKAEALRIEVSQLQQTFEDPASLKANISLDDVLSKKQKESNRQKNAPGKEKKEYVKNTVVHLQNSANATYLMSATCVEKVLLLVLAFLLENGLLSGTGQLVFFSDGAADLRSGIASLFSGLLPFKIILDWFHLEKKCKERLSMAMKGKALRNQVLDHIIPLLWHGKINAVINYLHCLNKDDIKNQDQIKLLIGYLDRNRSFIPCYVLRQQLGLRTSSNLVEKANDLVVSNRQKHNGMSWSTSGSTSLASVITTHLNSEYSNWLLNNDITFEFKNKAEKMAA